MIYGITAGTFDFLHAGHIDFLRKCSMQCDHLEVLLQTNPTIDRKEKNVPVQSTMERFMQLFGCKYVSSVIPYDTELDLTNYLLMLDKTEINDKNKIVRFLDHTYKDVDFTGKSIEGIILKYIPRAHNYSSTELRNRARQ